jgi:hypothetical protein
MNDMPVILFALVLLLVIAAFVLAGNRSKNALPCGHSKGCYWNKHAKVYMCIVCDRPFYEWNE